jgi:hypothetical protein
LIGVVENGDAKGKEQALRRAAQTLMASFNLVAFHLI